MTLHLDIICECHEEMAGINYLDKHKHSYDEIFLEHSYNEVRGLQQKARGTNFAREAPGATNRKAHEYGLLKLIDSAQTTRAEDDAKTRGVDCGRVFNILLNASEVWSDGEATAIMRTVCNQIGIISDNDWGDLRDALAKYLGNHVKIAKKLDAATYNQIILAMVKKMNDEKYTDNDKIGGARARDDILSKNVDEAYGDLRETKGREDIYAAMLVGAYHRVACISS